MNNNKIHEELQVLNSICFSPMHILRKDVSKITAINYFNNN